jgi:CHAD domain-containing protein
VTTQPRVDRTGREDATRSDGRLNVAKSRPAPHLRPPSTSPVELHGLIVGVLRPDVSAGDLIRVVIAPSVVDLLENLPIAREDKDMEGVHQARVAIRRIRSNLQTFESLLGRDWARGLRSDLAPLASDLGRVRDDDVLNFRLRRLVELHPEIAGEHMVEVLTVLSEQRLLDRMSLIARLDEPSTTYLLNRLVVEAVDAPGRPAIDVPATSLLEPVLRKRWRRLERAVDALPPSPEFDDLHRIRILTKRVRYASEAVAPAFGRKAKRFARAAAILQDQLGELNDAAVTRAWLSGISPVLTGPAAFTAGQLSQRMAVESSPNDHAWRKTYRALEKRFDSWLG